MEQTLLCPTCHTTILPTYYFCYNCGKNLKPVPPPTSVPRIILLFLGSIILAPLGIVWGVRYLRQPDRKARIIGIIAIVLTLLSFVIATKVTIDYLNKVNEEVTKQMNSMQGFY